MSKNKKDLPANSDINRKNDDKRHSRQEEYDNRGKDDLQRESDVRNTQRSEQMRDSQQGDERMIPPSKGRVQNQKPREQHPQ